MGGLSSKLTTITFGTSGPQLSRCTISSSGAATGIGSDSGSGLNVNGDFRSASKIWNAVWNDIADYQLLADKLESGRCYFDTKDGAKICNKRCQMAVIGIASDTFGIGVGSGNNSAEVPIAIGGWVLAFVDQEYECGTPLTNNENGDLAKMTQEEKTKHPERLVAIYKKPETREFWGQEDKKIEVKGRHWVKVK